MYDVFRLEPTYGSVKGFFIMKKIYSFIFLFAMGISLNAQKILKELWATGDTRKVAEGVLAEESIWKGNLNEIPGLTDLVVEYLDSIQAVGMLETVKGIV